MGVACWWLFALQFFQTSQSVLCASGVSIASVPPTTAYTAAQATKKLGRIFARCNQTLPGVRFVTVQFWKGTSTTFGFSHIQVFRDGACVAHDWLHHLRVRMQHAAATMYRWKCMLGTGTG